MLFMSTVNTHKIRTTRGTVRKEKCYLRLNTHKIIYGMHTVQYVQVRVPVRHISFSSHEVRTVTVYHIVQYSTVQYEYVIA